MPTPPHADVSTVLTRRRIDAAFATLNDPDQPSTGVALDDAERQVIAKALQDSPHPLGGFARTVLDDWDHLDADDQVAMLLLLADITGQPYRRRTPDRELGR